MKIAFQVVGRAGIGLVAFGVLLFLSAGTFAYWQGWAFLAAFTLSTMVPTGYLLVKAPEAVRRRMQVGPAAETRPVQRAIVTVLFVLFPAILIFGALDHRFGWSPVPTVISMIGDLLVIGGLGLTMAVVIQNGFAAANVTVESGQQVVSTGLYRVVRHPMYAGTLVMTVGLPLALGSWWGLLVIVPVAVVLVLRILDEERLLERDLEGYRDYERMTRFRLVPRVW